MDADTVSIEFTLNGRLTTGSFPAGMTALQVLREVLHLTGTKEGCGIGECGACTIIVDGRAVNACLMLGAQLEGRAVTTVEGLSPEEQADALHPLQEAFIDHHAVQCGFCTPGLLMSTKALLDRNARPDRREITRALSGNLCRCTGYHHIYKSVEAACGGEGES